MIYLFIVLGFVLGTFLEFAGHRALHLPWLYKYHKGHHDVPSDYSVGGSWKAYLATVGGIAALLAVIHVGVSIGFLIWYGVFTALHFGSHYLSAARRSPLDAIQDNHIGHHEDPTTNYGVTVPYWDKLFGTFRAGTDHNS